MMSYHQRSLNQPPQHDYQHHCGSNSISSSHDCSAVMGSPCSSSLPLPASAHSASFSSCDIRPTTTTDPHSMTTSAPLSLSPLRNMLPTIKTSGFADEPTPLYGMSPKVVDGLDELGMMMGHRHLMARSSISSSSACSSMASTSPPSSAPGPIPTTMSNSSSSSGLIEFAKQRAREYDDQERERLRVRIHDHAFPGPPPPATLMAPGAKPLPSQSAPQAPQPPQPAAVAAPAAAAAAAVTASHRCPQCTHRFRRRRDLMRHLHSVHSQRKQYNCPLCCSTFTRRDSLKRHARLACRAAPASSSPSTSSLPSPSTSPTLRHTHAPQHHQLIAHQSL